MKILIVACAAIIGATATLITATGATTERRQPIGFMPTGEAIDDCIFPVKAVESVPGISSMMEVEARRLKFRIVGEVTFDKHGFATFNSSRVVLADGTTPQITIMPLTFVGKGVFGSNGKYYIEAGTQCGTAAPHELEDKS